MESRLTKAAIAAFFLSLIILSLIRIEDTDTWVHLSIGREIFNLQAIPSSEPFTYPNIGQDFRYASWLFGLLLYTTSLLGGMAGIVVLKSAIVVLAFVILYRDAVTPYNERLIALVILSGFVVMARNRFVERPDIVLMVVMSYTVYALNAYIYGDKKYIYSLPLVATVWAGSQSSIVLLPVPFLACIVGGLIQLKLRNRTPQTEAAPNADQIRVIALIFILSIAATLINPHPFSQYSIGYGALASKWAKAHIVELEPLATWERALLCFGIITTGLSFIVNRTRFSLFHLLLVLPFFILPFSARRFLFLAGLIAAPVVARNLAGFMSGSNAGYIGHLIKKPLTICIVITWITGYTVLGVAGKAPLGYDFKLFGLGINEYRIPAGAVRYMDHNGIVGKLFNPFHWGGYLIWTGYPQRTVFIDPRGGLSEELLEKFSIAKAGNLWMLEQLFRAYGFEAVILDYPSREAGAKGLSGLVLSDPNWALVYWDDTALLYLRRDGRYQPLIQKDEYRFLNPAAGRNGISSHLGDPVTLARIEGDLLRGTRQHPSSKGFELLGHLHSSTGRYQEAIREFSEVLKYPRPVDRLSAYTGLGTVYYRLGDMNKSLPYYEKAVKIQKDGMFLYNLATIYIALGNDAKALQTLQEAIEVSPDLERAHTLRTETLKRLGKQ